MFKDRSRSKMFTVATAAATRDLAGRRSAFAVNRSKSASEMGSAALSQARKKCKIILPDQMVTSTELTHTQLSHSASSHHNHIHRTHNSHSTGETGHLSIPIRTASLSHSNLDSLSPMGGGSGVLLTSVGGGGRIGELGLSASARSSNDWSAIARLNCAAEERDDVDGSGKRCGGRRRHYDQNGSVVELFSPKKRFINAVNQVRMENNVVQAFADVNVESLSPPPPPPSSSISSSLSSSTRLSSTSHLPPFHTHHPLASSSTSPSSSHTQSSSSASSQFASQPQSRPNSGRKNILFPSITKQQNHPKVAAVNEATRRSIPEVTLSGSSGNAISGSPKRAYSWSKSDGVVSCKKRPEEKQEGCEGTASETKKHLNALMRIKMFAIKRKNRLKSQQQNDNHGVLNVHDS